MQKAFRLHSDRIWFISDGEVSQPEQILVLARRKNVGKKTTVNTAIFSEGGMREAVEFMSELAEDGGGVCIDSTGEKVSWELPAPGERSSRSSIFAR